MKWLEKGALALMTGVMPVFIAACYGMPMDGSVSVWGNVKDKVSKNPIGNILVRCMRSGVSVDETYTGAGDGSYSLFVPAEDGCEFIRFEDIDGEENGGLYQTKEIPFEDNASVELELAELTEK